MNQSCETENKPCSVKARQGFSVYYRNRYLYSQYDAEKPVTRLIDSLTILPETLILAFSPVLGTGLSNLLERLPQGCSVLAVEFDHKLFDFFMETDTARKALKDPRFGAVLLDRPERIAELLSLSPATALLSQKDRQPSSDENRKSVSGSFIKKGAPLPPQGSFRRCLPVEMSGGTAFNPELFTLVKKYADDAIATFWKNHITLTRLGRLYAKDLLSNIKSTGKAHPLVPHSVTKTILALGAGPSLDTLLPQIETSRNDFFILAADAALPALAQYDLRPDAVVAVESQIAIEKAYIGFENSRIPLIADLTSRPHVLSIMNGPVSLFLTGYCNEPFISRVQKLAAENGIPELPPLGSVGLYVLELALYLRTPGTPVCFSGLDFAWGKGSTHCKGAPAYTNALLTASRLNPPVNPGAAFGAGSSAFKDKAGAVGYTTPNLSGYGILLSERYRNTELLFDAGTSGMETGVPRITVEKLLSDAKKRAANTCTAQNDDISWIKADAHVSGLSSERDTQAADAFLAAEHAALQRICGLIDAEETCPEGAFREADAQELLSLLAEHSYVYLHFPDASRGPVLTRDFLVRVRAECIRFLKARR